MLVRLCLRMGGRIRTDRLCLWFSLGCGCWKQFTARRVGGATFFLSKTTLEKPSLCGSRRRVFIYLGYWKVGANLQMSHFINKISTFSATTLPISRHIFIQMLIYMYCLAEIWIVKTYSNGGQRILFVLLVTATPPLTQAVLNTDQSQPRGYL